jgi:hypothetical protein
MGPSCHKQIRLGAAKMTKQMIDRRISLCIETYFALLPFAYLFQVLTGRAEIAAIAYAPLLLAATIWVGNIEYPRYFWAGVFTKSNDLFSVGILFLFVHTTISVLLACGDLKYGLRGFFIYLLPMIIVPLASVVREITIVRLIKVIVITGVLVATELTFENFNIYFLNQTTVFQLLNYQYVLSSGGGDLSRLYATNYRPTGMLEHVHASVMWVGVSAIGSLAIFLIEGRRHQLILFSFLSATFALHGVRLLFGALLVGIISFLFFRWISGRFESQKVKTASLVFGVTIILSMLMDPFGTVKLYYLPAVLRNDFGISSGETPSIYYLSETSRFVTFSPIGQFFRGEIQNWEVIVQALFGFGVVNALRGTIWASDDAYFLQLISQYGLLGSILVLGMWLHAIRICYQHLSSPSTELKRVLAGFSMSILLVCIISIVHSPAIGRKAIYPLFLFAIAIAYRLRVMQLGRNTIVSTPKFRYPELSVNDNEK